jgi:dipeptidase
MVALPQATRHGQTLFAKNSDRPTEECQPLEQHPRTEHPPGSRADCEFVDVPQVSETYRHVGSRPWWCRGYEFGFNEHQVVIGNEGLPARTAQQAPKLIGMEIIRLGLERSRSAAEAVEVMTGLIGRYGQGKFDNPLGVGTYDNAYIVADPHEA